MTTISRRLVAHLVDLAEPVLRALSDRYRQWRVRGGVTFAYSARHASIREVEHEVEHEGATERFGVELRAMRDIEVSPELVSDIETELRWGLLWHDFERNMQAQIDRTFAPYLPETECANFDELRNLIGVSELVSV
jgi:hypothetical protein